MTAPARNLPARQNDGESSSASIGILPPELQQALQLRKMRNQVAGQLAAQNWGKSLDLETRRAIADWGQQFRVDVTTEIHVLGGNIYLNAAFYLRQLAEMIDAGLVEYAYPDHVEDDPRLKQLGAEGEGEYSRRLRERIMHGLPDKAASAVVFRVKLRSMTKEVTGAKACGNGVKKNDPVGDAAPTETSESRAARRAMRLIGSHVPKYVADDVERIETSAKVLTERVKEARAAFEIAEASHRRAPQLMPAVRADAPYEADSSATGNAREALRVVAAPRTESHIQAAETAAAVRDPYDDAGDVEANIRPEPSASGNTRREATAAPASTSGPGAFALPFNIGLARIKTPLAEISTEDLTRALKFATDVGKYSELVEAISLVLDDRRYGDAQEPVTGEASA